MTERLLLVTNALQAAPRGGREMLCRLNHDVLAELYGERLAVCELARTPVRSAGAVLGAFRGHLDGLGTATIGAVLEHLRKSRATQLFVDGSNLGELVRRVKLAMPQVRTYTFFHNVEARFFLGALRQEPTPRALAVLVANYLAERKAVRWSDRLVTLSERDSRLLARVYGRHATDISAMALRDALPAAPREGAAPTDRFALFVGGAFYANRLGIAWYARAVAPRVRIRTCVVGRGFERRVQELGFDRNIELVGEVASLADWYRRAYLVVAPIFDGSGMKTKVAEALMFGKKVIGTPEAFSGYEDIAALAGRICRSADEFVRALDDAESFVRGPFDGELRAAFEARYSYDAARERFARILAA